MPRARRGGRIFLLVSNAVFPSRLPKIQIDAVALLESCANRYPRLAREGLRERDAREMRETRIENPNAERNDTDTLIGYKSSIAFPLARRASFEAQKWRK